MPIDAFLGDKERRELLSKSPLLQCWEIPFICHFVWLFQHVLNMKPMTPADLEKALADPIKHKMFLELMSKLLIDEQEMRRRLAFGEGFSFASVCALLREKIDIELERARGRKQLEDRYHGGGGGDANGDGDGSSIAQDPAHIKAIGEIKRAFERRHSVLEASVNAELSKLKSLKDARVEPLSGATMPNGNTSTSNGSDQDNSGDDNSDYNSSDSSSESQSQSQSESESESEFELEDHDESAALERMFQVGGNREFDVLGAIGLTAQSTNPISSNNGYIEHMSAVELARWVKMLCDWRLSDSPEFFEAMGDMIPTECRILPLGTDSDKRQYFFFGFDDCRVYRQTPPQSCSVVSVVHNEQPTFELLCETVSHVSALVKQIRARKKGSEAVLLRELVSLEDELKDEENERRERHEREEKAAVKAKRFAVLPRKRSARIARIEEEHSVNKLRIGVQQALQRQDEVRWFGAQYVEKRRAVRARTSKTRRDMLQRIKQRQLNMLRSTYDRKIAHMQRRLERVCSKVQLLRRQGKRLAKKKIFADFEM